MNILGCSDEFFNVFLNMEVFWIIFTLALLNNIVPGKMGVNYYICTGEDPSFYQDLGSKVTSRVQFTHWGQFRDS